MMVSSFRILGGSFGLEICMLQVRENRFDVGGDICHEVNNTYSVEEWHTCAISFTFVRILHNTSLGNKFQNCLASTYILEWLTYYMAINVRTHKHTETYMLVSKYIMYFISIEPTCIMYNFNDYKGNWIFYWIYAYTGSLLNKEHFDFNFSKFSGKLDS